VALIPWPSWRDLRRASVQSLARTAALWPLGEPLLPVAARMGMTPIPAVVLTPAQASALIAALPGALEESPALAVPGLDENGGTALVSTPLPATSIGWWRGAPVFAVDAGERLEGAR
jgi:hypothetical protein